jgi:hypothetical protein
MLTRRSLVLVAMLFALSAVPARAADAVAGGNGGNVSLGKNWGPYETFGGASFRWIANDAEITVRGNGLAHVAIACEGGPSLGAGAFPLRVLDADGRQVDHAQCTGNGHPAELLLPVSGSARYVLHVDGGGRGVPGDKRTLNFRVFSLDAGGNAPGGGLDIASAANGVRLGEHWDPLEHYGDQTFRWISGNDAQVFVHAKTDLATRMRVLVAVGPSVGAASTGVEVRDASGKVVDAATVRGVQALIFPVGLRAGDNAFTLHVTTTKNVHVPHDPRLLNLRVFSIAALR